MQRSPLLRSLSPVLFLALSLGVQAQQPSDITAPITQIPSLALVKQEVIRYHQSGRYEQDIARSVAVAQEYLEQQVALEAELTKVRQTYPGMFSNPSPRDEKLAIVLDIDETALSNWVQISEADFGYNSKAWNEWVDKATATPIGPVLDLARYAHQNGISLVFVTGRRENQRAATEKNLKDAGYPEWVALILKPIEYKEESVVPFKTAARQQIAEAGYHILLNIGDQRSDLQGGYADKAVLLPNPFYGIP